ncbi:PD-(D/E)XK nuclease family protein [Roseivirga pacifica]|nr:PD-(D/E)XK nuclease family protein [Roseivirga pacifica]
MIGFHENIVAQIDGKSLDRLKDECFVFPTKRGGVFFKRALLAKYGDKDFMLPSILSIEEFVQRMTGMTITDELTLLFHLYTIYRQTNNELEFDDFYAWGKIILKDYDEIDRYMADAGQIYSTLQNIKEIDNVFGYNDEFRAIIERFRTLTERKEKTKLLTEFLKIWNEVGEVYKHYHDALLREEKAYGGMLYRNLATILEQDHFEHPFKFYHFCGFNALSKAEELIFDALVKAQKAQLYWDVDQYYVDNKREEAGDFMREYQVKWPNSTWFNADSLKRPKTVSLHAVPQNMAQAHLAAQKAQELIENGAKAEETAVVLADEKLLVPLLYALPLQDQTVNVTMGYPMRSTVVFDFVLSYLELMRKAKASGNELVFHVYDLRPFISNAYAAVFQEEVYKELNDWFVREKRTKVSLSELKELINSNALYQLLATQLDWPSISAALKQYLTTVFYQFKEQDAGQTDREFIYFFLKSLNQLNDYLEGKQEFSLRLIKKIVQEHFKAAKVPFEGEPVQGLQIMGFLETRTLDFKHLIVVSANDGKLPTPRNLNSYIPYSLRRLQGLPTFEEQEAIYAYHFKRLLQQAEDIHFIYDNTTKGDSTGEKSRFILQQLRLYNDLPNIKVERHSYEGKSPNLSTEETIEVEKGDAVKNLLSRFTVGAEGEKFLSPTSLTNYITCPLKFYLKNVASFREQDDVEEDIDARNLGIVVHEVLEFLYKPFVGKQVTAEQIKLLKPLVEKELIESLKRNKIVQDMQQLSGRDLVTKQVMEQMIHKVLGLDMKDAPFEVVGLEAENYEKVVEVADFGAVRISGTIDRMDMKDEQLRITDYKTGKVEFVTRGRPVKSDEEMLEEHFVDPKYKSGFQGYLYAVLAKPHFTAPIKVGITSMRKLSEGTQWLKSGQSLADQEIEAFDVRLTELVKEIYNPAVPFKQTEDIERCGYCEFATLCKRVN